MREWCRPEATSVSVRYSLYWVSFNSYTELQFFYKSPPWSSLAIGLCWPIHDFLYHEVPNHPSSMSIAVVSSVLKPHLSHNYRYLGIAIMCSKENQKVRNFWPGVLKYFDIASIYTFFSPVGGLDTTSSKDKWFIVDMSLLDLVYRPAFSHNFVPMVIYPFNTSARFCDAMICELKTWSL